jgi:hypothetical protein
MFFLVPFGGAMISAFPPVFDRLTVYELCPDATDYSYRDYGQAPISPTSPSGGTAHFTELTCSYADGTQQVFGNEEVGVKGLAAAFGLAAVCGGVVVLLLMVVAAILGARLVRSQANP